MAIFEWRKFNFFDLKENVDNGKIAETIKNSNISSATSGKDQLVICDSSGIIHVFTKTWEAISFKGHDGEIYLCEMQRSNNLLVTIGFDDDGTSSFKVWNLAKITKTGAPCLRTVKTALQNPSSLGVSENGLYMAIGYDRGSISLYHGDISRDRSKTLKNLSAGTSRITGIAFTYSGKTSQMFVCSDSGVLVYVLQSRDKENKIVLDTLSAKTRCCALQRGQGTMESNFMIGRDDAVYCYTSDGRGPCYALEGQKSILRWFRSHLLTVSKPVKSTISSQKDSVLTVIDIQNKVIVFSEPIDSVATIIIEFGTCYIITSNKKVYNLDEKDLQSKLSLLFHKNLYDIAVRVAKSNQYDVEGLADIFRQYGDHLYNKCDFAGSIDQYAKTIGYLEPSYVIRKFLDSRHIQCLTIYLQALHKERCATADHTTLLLNCFTRLDQTDQLKGFLKNDENPDLIFDLDVAIKVCRNASLDDALSLAKRNKKHDFVISILTEDKKEFKQALDYISNLNFYDVENNLKSYGNVLMENCPNETTEILKKLCTNFGSKSTPVSDDIFDLNSPSEVGNPQDFIHLFVKNPEMLIDFLEYLIANLASCSQLVYNTLIEQYLNSWTVDKKVEGRIMEILRNFGEFYDRNHVLILCRSYKFWSAVMFLYEEEKLYHLIVRYHLKNRDYENLLLYCHRLGSDQPSLWLQALTGLRNDKNAPTSMLSQILQVIATEKLQSPLQVLSCLAVESGPNLSSVRDYFLQVFQKENETMKQERELVDKYRTDSVIMKKHIENLQENSIEFRGTLCSTCNQALSLPAIYFFCQHSYHQDCLRGYSDNDKDCPVCHKKNLQLHDALRAQCESREKHETFHNMLDRSSEPFSVVAEYFGRGLFNKIVILKDDESQNMPAIDEFTKKFDESRINRIEDVLRMQPQQPSQSTTTEGKLRIQDRDKIRSNQVPIAEGRMRIQERGDSQYSSSLEANISRNLPVAKKHTPKGSPKVNTISANLANKNPFDEEEDDDKYPKNKNPFDDEDEHKMSTNPFDDECDSNFNPIE